MAGVSDTENKEIAKRWITDLQPARVLDIGAGQGTYSMLMEHEAELDGQHWTALEVFAPYVEMFDLKSKYDQIVISDARFVDFSKLNGGQKYDLTIAADMLEHMEKHEAKTLISDLLDHSHYLLICFPVEHQEQHAGDEGNQFETHVDHWTFDEMREFLNFTAGPEYVSDYAVGNVLAYFLVESSR